MSMTNMHRLGAGGPVSGQAAGVCLQGCANNRWAGWKAGLTYSRNTPCNEGAAKRRRARFANVRNTCNQKPLYKTRYMLDELG